MSAHICYPCLRPLQPSAVRDACVSCGRLRASVPTHADGTFSKLYKVAQEGLVIVVGLWFSVDCSGAGSACPSTLLAQVRYLLPDLCPLAFNFDNHALSSAPAYQHSDWISVIRPHGTALVKFKPYPAARCHHSTSCLGCAP